MGFLKDQMLKNMSLRGFSIETQKTYLLLIKQFVRYHMKRPDLLTLKDIEAYQYYLIKEKKVAKRTFNLNAAALKFFYKITLKRQWNMDLIPYMKENRRIPVIASKEELVEMYNAITNIKYKVIFLVLYSSGIRNNEMVHLQPTDIDSKRMVIRIRGGKGDKDRLALLSEKLLIQLRKYWLSEKDKLKYWLFPGQDISKPMTRGRIADVFRKVRKKADITKQITPHTLRHCFATHLLESGVDIKTIQLLLGHRYLKTTGIYLHVDNTYLKNTKSPVDDLDLQL